VDEILIKLNYYCDKFHINNVVIGGGVSANHLLQNTLKKSKLHYLTPGKQFTGDNAAMIA
jgi:N6-L-threonylcarbamoyladenine synthase